MKNMQKSAKYLDTARTFKFLSLQLVFFDLCSLVHSRLDFRNCSVNGWKRYEG